MATRFYFADNFAAPVGVATPTAEWEHASNATRALLNAPNSDALATTAYTPDGADDLTNKDANHRQYVGERLAAQTLSGNVTAQIQCLEANAANNLFLTMKILVCSEDGVTTRATLMAITRATSKELGTTIENRTFPSTALTNYTCIDGDRLVIEVGLGGSCSAAGGTQGHNGSIRWGCVASGGDLPVDETATGTTLRPWVQFSNTINMDPIVIKAISTSMNQLTASSGMCGLRWV